MVASMQIMRLILMMNKWRRMGAFLLLVAGMMVTGCRSTLHRAVIRGDIETVQAEINRGADANDKPHGAHALWLIPAIPAAVAVDIAQLGAAIGTLGLYAITMDKIFGEHECLMTLQLSRFMNSSVEEARASGREDIVNLLVDAGAEPPTNDMRASVRRKLEKEMEGAAGSRMVQNGQEAVSAQPLAASVVASGSLPAASAVSMACSSAVTSPQPSVPLGRWDIDNGKFYYKEFRLGPTALAPGNWEHMTRMMDNNRFSTLSAVEKIVGASPDATASDSRGQYDIWYYTRLASDAQEMNVGLLVTRSQGGVVKEKAMLCVPKDLVTRYHGDASMVRELKVLPTSGSSHRGLQKLFNQVSKIHNEKVVAHIEQRHQSLMKTARDECNRKIREDAMKIVENYAQDLVQSQVSGSSGAEGGRAVSSSSSSSGDSGEKTVTKRVDCSTCSGKGHMRGTLGASVTCPNCGGSGKLKITETTGSSGGGWKLVKETCTMCKGGKTIRSAGTVKACPGCRGRGYNHSIP